MREERPGAQCFFTHHSSLINFVFVFAREYFFAESFTRVTGLIVQFRRGEANSFLRFFAQELRRG